jgi:hypothetical protein
VHYTCKQTSDASFAQAVTAAVTERLQHTSDTINSSLLNINSSSSNSSSSSSGSSMSCAGVWLLVVIVWSLRGGLCSNMLDDCVATAKALYDRFGTAQTGWCDMMLFKLMLGNRVLQFKKITMDLTP